MKKSLFLLALPLLLATGRSYAQDKPVLNTTPPGAPVPTTAPPDAPVPAEAPPAAAPTPAVSPAAPMPQISPDRPSGLDLPSDRDARAAGGGSAASLSNRLFIYSGFGLGFSSYNGISQFNFSLSPALGYRLTDRLAFGPGISYAYSRFGVPQGYTFSNGESSISTNSIGLKVFAQYIVYHEFFVHAEYEVTRAEVLDYNLNKYRLSVTSPLAGLGYRNQFSNRTAGDILILYNFNDSSARFSLYPNPVIRFTFLFNLGH